MIRRIKLPQYECAVILEVVEDVPKRVASLYKKYKVPVEAGTGYEGICFAPTMREYYIIYTEKTLSYNLIAHELWHCVIRIHEDREIEGEEAGAWLMGYLTGNVYKSLLKANIPIQNA